MGEKKIVTRTSFAPKWGESMFTWGLRTRENRFSRRIGTGETDSRASNLLGERKEGKTIARKGISKAAIEGVAQD